MVCSISATPTASWSRRRLPRRSTTTGASSSRSPTRWRMRTVSTDRRSATPSSRPSRRSRRVSAGEASRSRFSLCREATPAHIVVAMKVFVTGATGAIDGHVVPALVGEGHTVSALARTPAKAATLTRQGAEPVSVSIFDRSSLAAAVAGHDAIVNLASAIPPMTQFMRAKAWRDNDRVRTEGSATLVHAATDAGVGRVVQESVSMLYSDQGSSWIDEDMPVDRYP